MNGIEMESMSNYQNDDDITLVNVSQSNNINDTPDINTPNPMAAEMTADANGKYRLTLNGEEGSMEVELWSFVMGRIKTLIILGIPLFITIVLRLCYEDQWNFIATETKSYNSGSTITEPFVTYATTYNDGSAIITKTTYTTTQYSEPEYVFPDYLIGVRNSKYPIWYLVCALFYALINMFATTLFVFCATGDGIRFVNGQDQGTYQALRSLLAVIASLTAYTLSISNLDYLAAYQFLRFLIWYTAFIALICYFSED
ncbi:hypothetical protein DFJ63DRAFT_317330 [Scheffersomyces coipomensis]|uniref:uncharacterized protein n=1 Tax=Scheffersomyces coipomensis TaxID=1788519 RepID=UPI00315DC111